MPRKRKYNNSMTNEILHRLENGEITITKAFNLLNQTTVLDYTTKIYDNNENPNQLEELLAELDGLIGLKKVKKTHPRI